MYAYIKEPGYNRFLIERVKKEILREGDILERYYVDEKDYLLFMNNLLADDSLPEYNLSVVANYILECVHSKIIKVKYSKDNLNNIMVENFKQFLNKNATFTPLVSDFYMLVRNSGEARNLYYNYLKNDLNNFEQYIRYFIRPRMQPPHDRTFVFDPFIKEFFDMESFFTTLKKIQTKDPDLKMIIAIIEKYSPAYNFNESAGISVTDDEFKFLIPYLKSTGQVPQIL
jgi:truncated hemoglobin YjbI